MRDSHPPMPHHSRKSSTITSISISVHIKSTHSLSIPAISRFHFTSFGKTTYCIYPPYIYCPLVIPPSSGTLTKASLPELHPVRNLVSARGHSTQIGKFSLYNRLFLTCTKEHARLSASLQTNLTASDKLGLVFFFFLWKGKSPALPLSKIMNCGVEHVHCPRPTA